MLNQQASSIGGFRSKELGTNFTSWDKDKHISTCSKGGATAGKIPMWTNGIKNQRSYECPGGEWFRGITRRKKNSTEMATYRYTST